MKILTNKKYDELKGYKNLYSNLEKDFKDYKINTTNDIFRLDHNIKIYEKKLEESQKENKNISNLCIELKDKVQRLLCAKGGTTKEINKLKKENKELKEKLAESMTDKYLIRKLPADKTKSTLKMKSKNTSKQSNIIKNIHKGV